MSSKFYANIAVSGGVAVNGDNYGTINHSTAAVDLQGLMQNLRQTTQQCSELRDCLLSRPTPVSSAKDLAHDIDELESLVTTLRFYLGENDLGGLQGWQRPLLDLNDMSCSYQRMLDRTQDIISKSRHFSMEQDIVNAMAMRAEARRLRVKLRTAIAIVVFCSYQDARDPHLQEVQAVYERLRDVLERIENERALNLAPAQPLTVAGLTQVDGNGSLIMRRFIAQSLSLDRTSLTAASMQVSDLIESEVDSKYESPFIEAQSLSPMSREGVLASASTEPQLTAQSQHQKKGSLNVLRAFYRKRLKYSRMTSGSTTESLDQDQLRRNLAKKLSISSPTLIDSSVPLASRVAFIVESDVQEDEYSTSSPPKDVVTRPNPKSILKPHLQPLISNETMVTSEGTSYHLLQYQVPSVRDYYSHEHIASWDPVSVHRPCGAQSEDSFQLERGDMLEVAAVSEKGWAAGWRWSIKAVDYYTLRADSVTRWTAREKSSSMKLFPLVCVCVPRVWMDVVSGRRMEQDPSLVSGTISDNDFHCRPYQSRVNALAEPSPLLIRAVSHDCSDAKKNEHPSTDRANIEASNPTTNSIDNPTHGSHGDDSSKKENNLNRQNSAHCIPRPFNHLDSKQLALHTDHYSSNTIRPGDLVSTLFTYRRRNHYEFEIEPGDMFKILSIWDDGWGVGQRCRIRAEEWTSACSMNSEQAIWLDGQPMKGFPLACICHPAVWSDVKKDLTVHGVDHARSSSKKPNESTSLQSVEQGRSQLSVLKRHSFAN